MSRMWLTLKKRAVLASMGGCTFAFGLSNATCTSNEALTNFYGTAGDAAIASIFDPASRIGNDFDAIVVQPTTTFVQTLWNTHVLTRIPQDPTSSLLTN